MSDSRLRRDVIWNLAPVVLLGVVGLGLNFAIVLWWDADALGVFNLVSIAYFVTAVVGACGLQYSVLRAVAADPEHAAPIVVGALVPNAVLAVAATGLFLLLRAPVASLMQSDAVAEGMLYAAPGLFCFAINKVLLGVVNGLRRMRAYAIYTSLRYLALAGALVGAHLAHVSAAHLAVIWSMSEGTLLVVLCGELVANVSLVRAGGWMRHARAHVLYGARGVVATLAYEINSKLDVWMIGAAGIRKELVGVYSIAAALNEGATQLSVVVQNNLNPMIARSLAAGERAEVTALVRRTRRWFVPAMAGACVLGAAVFPLVIPRLLGDPQFASGALPFAILMAGLALASPYLPFNQILLMANLPQWHTVLLVGIVTINFAGQKLLIPQLDLVGAGAATALAVIGQALLVRRAARVRANVII